MIHLRMPWVDHGSESQAKNTNVTEPNGGSAHGHTPRCIDERDKSLPIGNRHGSKNGPDAAGFVNLFVDPAFYLAAIVAVYLLITIPAVRLAALLRSKIKPSTTSKEADRDER